MPPTKPVTVRRLPAEEAGQRVAGLSAVLIDVVEGGASIGFMAPFTRERADRFWQSVADGVAAGDRALLVAERSDGEIMGTVQVLLRQPENQPHRGEIAKLLVRRWGWCRGTR